MPIGTSLAVDRHPQRQEIIDAILAREPSRSIAARIKPPLSFQTIHSYGVKHVKPALQKAIGYSYPASIKRLADELGDTPAGDAARQVLHTKAALAEHPILSRIARKYDRYDKLLSNEQLEAGEVVAVDKAETMTMRLHAELAGLIGGQAQQRSGDTYNIVVMPRGDGGDVIDVVPVD